MLGVGDMSICAALPFMALCLIGGKTAPPLCGPFRLGLGLGAIVLLCLGNGPVPLGAKLYPLGAEVVLHATDGSASRNSKKI